MPRGNQLNFREKALGVPLKRTWTIDADDFGLAPTTITLGDMDGSGEAPGIQLEFEHDGCPAGAAVAYSAREAELVSRALSQAASIIKPHERLRMRKRKWERTLDVAQPVAPKPVETVALGSIQEASDLLAVLTGLDDKDPRKARLADVITQLELPF